MHIARLDNEVFFKKAFTDPVVLKAFVKDVVGVEIEPDIIETEKAFSPKTGSIQFRYDIFAEDSKRRIVVEIQKVEYDHNFDRFLHYHLQAITEQQRSSSDYSIQRTVYTIVVITAPYKMKDGKGLVYQDEVLISSLNPRNLKNLEREIYNHELIFLNPNYKGADTPLNYRDWLDLIYESIHHPEQPKINLSNPGVKQASMIVAYDNISPAEWHESKMEVGRQKVLTIERETGRQEAKEEMVLKGLSKGMTPETLSDLTGLTLEEIEAIRLSSNN